MKVHCVDKISVQMAMSLLPVDDSVSIYAHIVLRPFLQLI